MKVLARSASIDWGKDSQYSIHVNLWNPIRILLQWDSRKRFSALSTENNLEQVNSWKIKCSKFRIRNKIWWWNYLASCSWKFNWPLHWYGKSFNTFKHRKEAMWKLIIYLSGSETLSTVQVLGIFKTKTEFANVYVPNLLSLTVTEVHTYPTVSSSAATYTCTYKLYVHVYCPKNYAFNCNQMHFIFSFTKI